MHTIRFVLPVEIKSAMPARSNEERGRESGGGGGGGASSSSATVVSFNATSSLNRASTSA